MTLIFSTSLPVIFWAFSSIPLEFLHLELGKVFGAFSKIELVTALIVIGAITPFTIAYLKLRKLSDSEFRILIKKKRTIKLISVSLAISLIVLFSFSAMLVTGIREKHEKMNIFVSENMSTNLHDYIDEAEIFLNDNLHNSWDRPEAEFEIDNRLYITLLDPTILNSLGLTRADVILYQGWGSCGQESFVIEELLHRAGYTTRRAHFIGEGADHGWAEVYWNGSWFIVNPWWLGKWVEIANMRWIKPAFENYTTVEVMYRNGTTLDLGEDYGY